MGEYDFGGGSVGLVGVVLLCIMDRVWCGCGLYFFRGWWGRVGEIVGVSFVLFLVFVGFFSWSVLGFDLWKVMEGGDLYYLFLF